MELAPNRNQEIVKNINSLFGLVNADRLSMLFYEYA